MKKLMTALLAVAFLSGTAFAADQATKDAAKAQADKARVEETHQAKPAKKAKKAKKAKADAKAETPAPAAAPAK